MDGATGCSFSSAGKFLLYSLFHGLTINNLCTIKSGAKNISNISKFLFSIFYFFGNLRNVEIFFQSLRSYLSPHLHLTRLQVTTGAIEKMSAPVSISNL